MTIGRLAESISTSWRHRLELLRRPRTISSRRSLPGRPWPNRRRETESYFVPAFANSTMGVLLNGLYGGCGFQNLIAQRSRMVLSRVGTEQAAEARRLRQQ